MKSSVFSVAVVISCLGGTALAQGRLTGRVTDTGGLPLPGTAVMAEDTALDDAVRTVFTSEDGTFLFDELPAGRYSLTFSIPGFASADREGLEVGGADCL